MSDRFTMSMEVVSKMRPKECYSTPKLWVFGGVRALTGTGSGSRAENTGKDVKPQPTKKP